MSTLLGRKKLAVGFTMTVLVSALFSSTVSASADSSKDHDSFLSSWQDAIVLLTRVRRCEPRDAIRQLTENSDVSGDLGWFTNYILAFKYEQLGEFNEAESRLRSSVVLQDQVLCSENSLNKAKVLEYRPDTLFQLGKLLEVQNRLDEAETEYRMAIKSSPSARAYWDAYANLLSRKGMVRQAEGVRTKAPKLTQVLGNFPSWLP